jgi:SAM-dependent methyltransferase
VKCRHCETLLTHVCLDLGSAPPSNSYLTKEQLLKEEVVYPLRLLVCDMCYLVQTEDFANREQFFSEDYAYFSSYSSSWLAHAKQYVAEMQERFQLNEQSMVVEIAANDGYLLQYVKEKNIPCYGVEPTSSTAKAAKEIGITIIERFFGEELANELSAQGKQANLIAANNVLAHVPDINDFVKGFTTLLKPTGVATFEFPHVLNMVQQNQFDTVYHEHFSYLSLTTVKRIFEKQGLNIFDVEELSTHGGSLRVFAQKGAVHAESDSVNLCLQQEMNAKMNSINFYLQLQTNAQAIKHQVLKFLDDSEKQGLKVAAYGAAAKGNTFLNFIGVNSKSIRYVVDANVHKQNKFMPGSKIPIVDMHYLNENPPDIVFILPWNLKNEIVKDLKKSMHKPTKLIVAIPSLQLIND